MDLKNGNPSFVAKKGHFVVYTADWKRFAIPLEYLSNEILRELFKMSEEEFGVSSDMPIRFPCDSAYMDYILALIRRGIAKDFEKLVINSITTGQYCSISASSDHGYACATCLSWNLCLNSELQRQKQTRKVSKWVGSVGNGIVFGLVLKMIISAKKLVKLARKWQKLAAISRKRLTFPQTISSLDSDDCSTSSTAEKGHFVVYTTDEKRFVLPLDYLNNEIVKELFNLAEEEFGLTSNGPLTLPCDAAFMEYAITMIKKNVAKDVEKALLITLASNRCSSSLNFHHDVTNQQFLKMISAKKLVKLARKWQKLAAISRKRLTFPHTISSLDSDDCSASSTAEKGHFVVYTTDEKRFVLPLDYLNNEIVKELFNLAEEEFGLTSNGPLALPCDAAFMEYSITMIKKNVAKDVEKALLITLASNRCSSTLYPHQEVRNQEFFKMISAKKLIKLARKWQKLAAIRRKRIEFPGTVSGTDSEDCSTSSTAEKGHFVVYTTDNKRFVLPLDYLNNEIVRELFNLAEEEYGLTGNAPLTLPCDAAIMEYAITLIQQNVAKDVEKALLMAIASSQCSSSLDLRHEVRNQQLDSARFVSKNTEIEFRIQPDTITMINLMRLVKFAKKWKKLAAPERKRISIPRSGEDENTNNNDRLPVANKGHFFVYTVDQRRFEFPISYLNSNIFRELLAVSEEEFGLPRNGPITLLCDAMFMKYAASLMQRNVDKDMEKALHKDITSSGRCSLSFHSLLQEQSSQQLLVC
ncbi:hypothetical protein NC653_023707 [Populus alba x Populus x berolinensis]|uniref:Uncharacterized protein n=1 Tax=Populus alba x Populus x berolinensis TaxID=444605 RepID=A0AAD6MIA7_9ROSI|nr:hypothetical protein NC653_023707 [Populus alba x Populus x berolinensis]